MFVTFLHARGKKIETTLYINITSYNLPPYLCFIIMKHVYMNTYVLRKL